MKPEGSAYLDRLTALELSLKEANLEQISHPLLNRSGVQLWIKREDQLHPIISGNKWRKLKYILRHAFESGYDHLISMGGPWSNHLHALAFIGNELGVKTTGIIRGEMPAKKSTTLQDIENWGMNLKFVSRVDFRQLRSFHEHNSQPAIEYGGYWIPEGGASHLALKGVAEIVDDLKQTEFDMIALACGTGTTLAGIAASLPTLSDNKKVLGFAALKGAEFLRNDVADLLRMDLHNWTINLDYHFGGFAKTDQVLFDFMDNFEKQTAIQLDPIYTGKMMFGLFELIKQGYFPQSHKVIAIHTGGLQGRTGFQLQINQQ